MQYCKKRFMRMSVDEAYDVYKMNLSNEMHCVARSTFGKLCLKDVVTIDHTPVHQCCCHTCQNFRLILPRMICCGFKGIHRNARKAVKASISNSKFTKNSKSALLPWRMQEVLLPKRKNVAD